ncbi:MAG TPA: SulP family inorganic anion transporter [Leptospiraceae bacterium]|nr:SulP family inorganic anion transporter [Leptospiraceae bacterium]
MGLYTVIFACCIGFIFYLIRPGNYVGTPGIAAGLAPALALGVDSFGMANMPFLVFATACLQAVVWKFNLQRYILKFVPHFLVEGLLAGVGLKIALNFLPYVYTTSNPSHGIFHLDRIIVVILSILSLSAFLYLYNKYGKTLPGLSYSSILLFGTISMFFISLPTIEVEQIDFKFEFPMPHGEYFKDKSLAYEVVLMIGYAVVLGSIDVIEQVMSNAAIEKLDPLNRRCDTNNSLLAIWVANLGSSFFGGMTNLDGLAKSSTNAFAGAYTKLSNLFTAAVISVMVIFPHLLSYLPEYTLGVIMIFTGWKMISGLGNVARAYGKYELSLAIVCGLLVFRLGIFEGLLIALAVNILIGFVYHKSRNREISEIWSHIIFHTDEEIG